MDNQTLYHTLYQMIGTTQAQTLIWVKQDGTVESHAGVDLANRTALGILFAQVAEAFQHIMGIKKHYDALFFVYESTYRRYTFVSAYKKPLLAAVYLYQISPPPPLGVTRYLLRNLYQSTLRELPISAENKISGQMKGTQTHLNTSRNTMTRIDTYGAHSPDLYQALALTCEETDAKLLLATAPSGAVVEAYGQLEDSPATIGALASASLAEFSEVENVTGMPMKKAHVLLDGGENSIMIFKGGGSDLTFVSIVPTQAGSLGLSYAMTAKLSEKKWNQINAPQNFSVSSHNLPETGELLLGDWGNDDDNFDVLASPQ